MTKLFQPEPEPVHNTIMFTEKNKMLSDLNIAEEPPGFFYQVEWNGENADLKKFGGSFKEITGLNPEPANLAPYLSMISGNNTEPASFIGKRISECRESGVSVVCYTITLLSGETKSVRDILCLTEKERGREKLFGVVYDITEKRQALKRLERTEQSMKLFMEKTGDIMFHLSDSLNIIWANRSAEEKFSIGQQAGEKCYKLLHGQDSPCPGCPVEELREGGKAAASVIRLSEADEGGTDFYVHFEIEAVSVAGSDYGGGFIVRCRDVSDRINYETSLKYKEGHTRRLNRELARKMDDLEELNRELESLTYSVSHDLRAPLRSIDGFSQALLEDYGQALDSNALHYLNRIRASAQRMGELIDDLLSLSRLSRQEIKPVEIDLTGMCSLISGDLQKNSPARDAIVNIERGMKFRGDLNLLRTVMENLIHNAWKFTSGKEETRIDIGYLPGAEEKTVYIKDNGAGFNMEYSDKMFAVFQRLHTDREFPGTGIGLATVQKILSRHGCRVWAEGEKDKGATFYFTVRE